MLIMQSFLRAPRFIFVLVGTLLLAIPFHVSPDNFIVDDGYFYPQIARYIVHGAGSTFNGIMPTNGYHPLWMFVCIPVAAITSNPHALVQILGTIQDLLLLCCLAALVAITRAAKMRGVLLGCIPLLFMGMVLGIWRLLETTLSLTLQFGVLLLVLPLLADFSSGHSRRWKNIATGMLLGLAMLARLDLIFFSIVVLAYNLLSRRKDLPFQEVFLQGCIAGTFVASYLLWNWSQFHHLLPISGAIKSTFPHAHAWHLATFMYPVLGSLLLNTLLLFKPSKNAFETANLLLAGSTALQMAYSLSFGELAPWYLTTGYLSVAFSVIWAVNFIFERMPRVVWIEPLLASLLLLAFVTLGVLRLGSNFTYTRLVHGQVRFGRTYAEPKRALGEKLRDTLPAGSRIFIFDAPGGVAFYSGMSLLPADGLVADYAYNKEVVDAGFCGYAANHQIRYFVAPYMRAGQVYDRLDLRGQGRNGSQTMTIEAPLTHKTAGSVRLSDSTLVFRAPQMSPELESSFPEVGVWRIDSNQPQTCERGQF